MSDFISSYLDHTTCYESSTSFWRWSGYSAIAAVLRDNCYRRQGDSAIYPSNFVLFLARSSYDRKNNPVVLCEQLVNRVANTKVISGRASIQGIMDELGRTETDRQTGKITKGGAAILFAPELGAAIVEDPAAIKCLTDIYDFKPNPFKSILRTQPRFQVNKIVFSMLAASNEDMIRDVYSNVAVNGGLLARTMLVMPSEFRPGNSLWEIREKDSFENLVRLLSQISGLAGEYDVSEEAKEEFDKWYKPFRESYRDRSEKTGVLGRIHTHALKLAMVLAANCMTLRIEKKHIEEAIDICVALLPNYTKFAMSTGSGNIKEAGAAVLEALLSAKDHKLTQRVLIQQHWSKFDIDMLDKVTNTFVLGGMLERLVEGSEISYRLTQKCIEMLEGRKGTA